MLNGGLQLSQRYHLPAEELLVGGAQRWGWP